MKFTPRKTAPAKNDKHYYSNENIFYACGYSMPNCTAYAWGRLYELTGKRLMSLCGNAEDWFDAAASAGLKTGQTPKLGAIACYRAGKVGDSSDGAGHVAIVEEIKANGDIVTSNSAWQGTEFYLKEVTKASGYMYASDRPLLGFIYCGVEYESTASGSTNSTTSVNTVIKAGSKIRLNNTKCYSSETAKDPYGTKSGLFYLWDNVIKNGRIRITNSTARVGVKGQVTCWVNVVDVGLKASTTTSGTTTASAIKAGTKVVLNNAPVYSSELGATIGKRSGTYYTWDTTVKNGRIRMTNSTARVGVKGQVSFFIDVKHIK